MKHEFTSLGFPFIRESIGVTSQQIDRIAKVLIDLLQQGGMNQMSVALGLCNALSFTLEGMLRKVQTLREHDSVGEVEENLEHILSVLRYRRRHGLEPFSPCPECKGTSKHENWCSRDPISMLCDLIPRNNTR